VEANQVTVLVNGAERGADINLDEAKTALTEAEARFNKAQNGTDRSELLLATQVFKRARARVQAAGGNA
jgi:F-type H+-transporting ATPase subunit epsilon